MKKWFTGVMTLTLLLTLVACGGEVAPDNTASSAGSAQSSGATSSNVSQENTQPTEDTQETAWYFESNGVRVFMNDDGAATVAALGDPISYFEAEGCAGLGVEKTYTYSGFELVTYEDESDGTDKVYSIYFIDDSIKTPEGIRVGDSLTALLDAYACDYESGEPQLALTKGNCTLYIGITNDTVSSIEYLNNEALG